MELKEKAKILDSKGIEKAVVRISHEILEKNKGTKDLIIVGIRNRGEYLAQRIVRAIEKISKKGEFILMKDFIEKGDPKKVVIVK